MNADTSDLRQQVIHALKNGWNETVSYGACEHTDDLANVIYQDTIGKTGDLFRQAAAKVASGAPDEEIGEAFRRYLAAAIDAYVQEVMDALEDGRCMKVRYGPGQ